MAFLNLPWERCWCFQTVRAGSIASAIYALVCAVLRIFGAVAEELLVSHSQEIGNITSHNAVTVEVERSMMYVELALGILLLAAGLCLILGICKHKAFLLIPFLVLFGIIIAIEALGCFLMLLSILLTLYFGFLIALTFVLLFLFIDTSCFLCVISHYLNLRAGRESMRAVYRSQGERLPDYEEGAAALPQKGVIPTNSNMYFSPMSDTPVTSLEGEAPPPYRAV